MGQDNYRDAAIFQLRFLLHNGLDVDAVLTENGSDFRQHAGTVQRLYAQVIGGLNILHRQHRQIFHCRRLEAKVGNPLVALGSHGTGRVDDIGDNR